MSAPESQPLLGPVSANNALDLQHTPTVDRRMEEEGRMTWRMWTAEKLESRIVHWTILALIVVDSSMVVADLAYTLLKDQCSPSTELPWPLEASEYASIVISSIFVIEIPLSLWALGWEFYDPVYGVPHAPLHDVDALVIIGTFILEVVLRGKDRELAGLFVLLRFWRIVKLVGGVAVGVGEIDEESAKRLARARIKMKDQEAEINSLKRENQDLWRRIQRAEDDLEG